MEWDAHMPNMFNRLAPDTWLSNPSTEIKLDIMRSLSEMHAAKGTSEYQLKEKNFNRELMRYLLLAFDVNKDSKLWQANQYKPPGIKKFHMGIESIIMNAKTWLDDINSTNPRLHPNLANNPKPVLDKIINSSMNTVLILQSQLKDITHPEMISEGGKIGVGGRYVRETGVQINYLEQLEKALGKTPEGKAAYDAIASGQRYLPGGIMYRFPVTTNAQASLIDINYLAIPDDIGEMLGMNANTYYAHSILSALQGSDNDGDFGVLHFREINDIQQMSRMAVRNRETLNEILDNTELQRIMRENRIETDLAGRVTGKVKLGAANRILGWAGEHAVVSSYGYDKNTGLVKADFYNVPKELLDSSDAINQMVAVARGIAQRTPAHAQSATILGEQMKGHMPALFKELVPSVTNQVKKINAMILTAAQAGRIPEGITAPQLMGTINHNLAGILGQLPFELGKHIDPKELGESMMVLDFFNDPEKNWSNRDFVFGIWDAPVKKWVEPPPEAKRREAFDFLIEEIKFAKRMARFSDEAKIYDTSATNVMLGRKGTTFWDVMNITRDFNYNAFSQEEPGTLRSLVDAFKTRFPIDPEMGAAFKKGGKYAAISAAVLLGLSFFKPFDSSHSLNPIDSFIEFGGDLDSRYNLVQSDLELPRRVPLDMVNASFSKEAHIQLNTGNNTKRQRSTILSSVLRDSQLLQPYEQYTFRSKPYVRYSNYTMNIPFMGTSDLDRKSRL